MNYSRRHITIFIWFVVITMSTMSLCYAVDRQQLWNDSHIKHLRDTLNVNGEECSVIRIYANAPDYEWVIDDDEGATCVDDVARTVRMYFERYLYDKDELNLVKARGLIRFMLQMMAEDGEYYNFVWQNGDINKEHRTSIKSLDWWAARAFRTLALASTVNKDDQLKSEIENSINKTIEAINSDTEFYNGDGFDRYSDYG